ncbi:hypothetical protein [Xanthomarina sp. F2636L]|uniref:hypothetical protein n=1 Tax=Xanthomarina sp. F2636L TaxID=2996018 RepID=UPI00225DF76A|nr:hypothetical protein [Xanthomarina sp. F2636L]MCX7549672.1 hypothetical protein [Xanthomarina sp. F2636L]
MAEDTNELEENIPSEVYSFPNDVKDNLVGVLQSEYSSLKAEQTTRIAIRENTYLTNFLAIGAILSVAFSSDPIEYSFFLLIPVISTCIYWVYLNNDLMISKLQLFFEQEFPLKVLNTLNSSDENYNYKIEDVLDKISTWELFHRNEDKFRSLRKFMNTLFLVIGFVGINISAILLTFSLAIKGNNLFLGIWIFDLILTLVVIISLLYTKDW